MAELHLLTLATGSVGSPRKYVLTVTHNSELPVEPETVLEFGEHEFALLLAGQHVEVEEL